MPMELIDLPSLILGMCIGSVVTVLLLIGSMARDHIDSHKRMKREIRQAQDQGYADGRKWRGCEKVWLESNFEAIWKEIEGLRGHQDEREN